MVSDVRPSILGRYRIVGQLSTDSTTHQVLLAEDLRHSGRRCALKLSAIMSPRAFELARREFEILRRLYHPGIAEVFDFGRLDPSDLEEARIFTTSESSLPSEAGFMAYIASVYYEGLHLREAFLRLCGSTPPPSLPRGAGAGKRWKVFLEALGMICEALDAVHSRGLIHYDIKPENLLLIPNGTEGVPTGFEVKILDFGLSEADTTPLGTRLRGTVPFLAPELLKQAMADRRSDLFSLGVAIAYAITGRFPFPGSTPKRWLVHARRGRLVDQRQLCPDAPPGFLELVARLCSPEPQDRPPDALAVLANLERVGGFTLAPRKRYPARLVPRTAWQQELSFVQGELERLKRAEAEKPLLLFEGDPGQFPNQILDEVEALARAEGVSAYTGSCRLPRRYPHQPFAEIVRKICLEIDLSAPRFARFLRPLSAFAPIPLPAGQPLPPLPPRLEISRFLDLVTEFFLEVARQAPLVLCFRDLHLAGRDSLELLRSLARNVFLSTQAEEEISAKESLDPPRLLLLGTFRETDGNREAEAEASENSAFLKEMGSEPYATRVRLKNLTLDQTPEWLRERAPLLVLSGEFLRRLHEKSAGVPRVLDEFVRRVLEKPKREGGREIQADPEVLISLHGKAEDSALERMGNLPAQDRRLLEVLAVANGPLRLEEIAAFPSIAEGREASAVGLLPETHLLARFSEISELETQTQESLLARLKHLEEHGFVELREGIDGLEASINCSALAEQIYRQMREDARATFHRELALLLLDHARHAGPNRIPEDVTFHARLGGWSTLFFDQVLLAADGLARAHAFSAAARLHEDVLDRLTSIPTTGMEGEAPAPRESARPERLERFERFLPPTRPDTEGLRFLSNERLAKIYFERGHLQRALEKLTVLSSLLEGFSETLHRAAVYRQMGEIYQNGGELGNASYFLEKSLKLLRQAALPRPKPPPSLAAAPPDPGRTTTPGIAGKVLDELLLTLLAIARYRLLREELELTEKVLQECMEAAAGNPLEREALARTYLLQAEIEMRRSNHGESLNWNLKALALARESGDLALYSEALGAVGSDYVAQGVYDKAIAHFEQRLEVARRIESKSELSLGYSSLGKVYHNRSDHQRSLDCYMRSLHLKRQIGDLRGIAKSYNNLGIVYQVKDDLAQASECYKRAIDLFSRTNDQHGMAAGMNNLSSILELEGKYNEALDYSFRALEKRKKLRSRSGTAFCYYRIGKIYQSKGELDKALSYAEKSLALRQELGEKLGIAYSRLQLSELYLSQADYRRSFRLCRHGLKDFERLENEIGVLLAREVLARLFFRLGELRLARGILIQVLERSHRLEQRMLVGSCLLYLGRIAAEEGELPEAEEKLHEAEKLFRVNLNRREVAESLLERCALEFQRGYPGKASAPLEEAYSILEQMGVRDLVPVYFLLRSRLVLDTAHGDLETAGKFLERGLVETRELKLPELRWRFHFHVGRLEARRGDMKLARIHFQQSQDLLDEISSRLPPFFHKRFHGLREHLEFRKLFPSAEAEGSFFAEGGAGAAGPGAPSAGTEATSDSAATEPVPSPHPEKVEDRSPREEKQLPALSPEAAPSRADRAARGKRPVMGEGAAKTQAFNHHILKLHEIAAAMGTERNLRKLLQGIMDAVLQLVDAERGFLILKGAGSGETSITVARNLDREQILEPEQKVSASVAQEVLRTGKPVIAGNALDERRFHSSKSIHDMRLRSLICVPLRFRSEILGAIYLDNRHRRDAFRLADLNVLQAFADQASVAVANARLIEENQTRTAELIEANRQKEILNLKLRRKVQQRTAQLALAWEDLRNRQDQLEHRYRFENIVGKSAVMQEIFALLVRVSPTSLPVLLEGESGTGKELIARAIHFNSTHKMGRFVSENCGALTESLLETELFGHVRGAFTGAIAEQQGLFELAHDGTLLLDEVGNMSLNMQQKLLRVLEEGEIRRVGGKDKIPINVRIVSASNMNLRLLVERGKFREDLFYRLNGIRLHVPSLKERKEDIPLLVEYFLEEAAVKKGEPPREVESEAMRALMASDWPGNVRELRHFVEKTLLIASGNVIRQEDLLFDLPPLKTQGGSGESPEREGGASADNGGAQHLVPGGVGLRNREGGAISTEDPSLDSASLRSAKESFERDFLAGRLRETSGNVSLAAKACGVSRETFYRLLRKYGLAIDRG